MIASGEIVNAKQRFRRSFPKIADHAVARIGEIDPLESFGSKFFFP